MLNLHLHLAVSPSAPAEPVSRQGSVAVSATAAASADVWYQLRDVRCCVQRRVLCEFTQLFGEKKINNSC